VLERQAHYCPNACWLPADQQPPEALAAMAEAAVKKPTPPAPGAGGQGGGGQGGGGQGGGGQGGGGLKKAMPAGGA
jgi:hypothetical protein